jgi:hypothetical protein
MKKLCSFGHIALGVILLLCSSVVLLVLAIPQWIDWLKEELVSASKQIKKLAGFS